MNRRRPALAIVRVLALVAGLLAGFDPGLTGDSAFAAASSGPAAGQGTGTRTASGHPAALKSARVMNEPPIPRPKTSGPASAFARLPGWEKDNHAAALAAFLRVCATPDILSRPGPHALTPEDAARLCSAAHAAQHAGRAKAFLEEAFVPVQLADDGFLTGYFEPEFAASRTPHGAMTTPLRGLPEGFVKVSAKTRPANWPDALAFGRRTSSGLAPLPDRSAIMDGALAGQGKELAYLDKVDAFFIHVQGSARLRLNDGSVMRVGYAGKTGHPYTSIARELVLEGRGQPEDFTMAGLRQWLRDHPQEVDGLLRRNRSYIFFREMTELSADQGPVGALGLPLVPGRSLAVDPEHVRYGLPVFLSGQAPGPDGTLAPLHRLVIADDTGSAIKGAGRGDLFTGSGDEAGHLAGELRHRVGMTLLVPRAARAAEEAKRP